MTAGTRHSWSREAEHLHRCRVCGLTKRNEWRQAGPWPDQGRWVAAFEAADGARSEGRTPPCPGPAGISADPGSVLPETPEILAYRDTCPTLPTAVPPAAPWTPPAPVAARPVPVFRPLLAGPPDPRADAYRERFAATIHARGGCGYCRHWQGDTDRCGHPAHGPAPITAAAAREGDGWPLDSALTDTLTLAARPFRTLADGTYRLGGACGPGARYWEARP